nr:PLP-dependent aminotransferase family protein [Kibdelosporangium sp. MJ126-NF4]CEL16421.1 putative aminotransferase [Kibdelosporangium sp. MJ126-NF4]CTQ90373.1 putative aminotransferase [Kibdelosporangium sp. MJ126-NF4]
MTKYDLVASLLCDALQDPSLTSMNFLNEVAERYPDALSFAAGRPVETFFDLEQVHEDLRRFCDHLERTQGRSAADVRRTVLQYGRTKGIVHDLVARNLAVDEGMTVDPEAIVVTVGCQEAMVLVLRALRRDSSDVVLAVSPTYVGLTGAARLVDLPVTPVRSGPTGVDFDDLTRQIRTARQAGQRPRACYVMPDFANPSGVSMDLATRRRLLDVAEQEDILLLEDNPYGLFHFGDHRTPTLKALDDRRRVVYLGSFAKSAVPGARVGYVVADQRVRDANGTITLLADELSKIKSMLTVNTSPIAQAVIGGRLLAGDGSLVPSNEATREHYERNVTQIIAGLAARFGEGPLRDDVSWNVPAGGFFVVVTVPFDVDDQLLEQSAKRYGVLWTPMSHFYGSSGGERQLRLSASVVTPEQIEIGLDRLYAFVSDRVRALAELRQPTA